MGRHAPALGRANEDIGGKNSEVGCPALQHATDILDAGYPAAVTLRGHVHVLNIEVHETGVVEYPLPAGFNVVPTDQGLPARMNAQGPGRGLPRRLHGVDIEGAESVIKTLVGRFDGLDVSILGRQVTSGQYGPLFRD